MGVLCVSYVCVYRARRGILFRFSNGVLDAAMPRLTRPARGTIVKLVCVNWRRMCFLFRRASRATNAIAITPFHCHIESNIPSQLH